MAIRTITHHTDDLDGSTDDVETVTITVWGRTWDVDLNRAHRDGLHLALGPYLDAAREVKTQRRTRPTGGKASAAQVRRWAVEHGIDIPRRGRIPHTVMDQYTAQHTSAA